jgi:hypothetical protein
MVTVFEELQLLDQLIKFVQRVAKKKFEEFFDELTLSD